MMAEEPMTKYFCLVTMAIQICTRRSEALKLALQQKSEIKRASACMQNRQKEKSAIGPAAFKWKSISRRFPKVARNRKNCRHSVKDSKNMLRCAWSSVTSLPVCALNRITVENKPEQAANKCIGLFCSFAISIWLLACQ
ncbi:hypothetical protein BRADI_1g09777v3 [Brachypodium distachyon]|uniref:Uncharacterized protein n=1 Tax=Brachypodium distachyon TaxID=15368 RepID=A0A2K2DIU5_BRADI|nr:hypothetical protein BRADI_1g09777v3 [Brachypodium distachyon]